MSRKALLAKVSRPRLFDVVPRERLFALLDENRGRPLVWIASPPGAGKTTLIASYLEARGIASIWYQIDAGDADPATQLVEAGDVIDLGDRVFEVIHVPGHSPGSIALWEEASGVLFSGDAVYDGPLVDDAYHSHVPTYLDSMRRLRELPVDVVHGGHFASFGRERFRQVIDEYVAGKRAGGCPAGPESR